MKLFKIAMATLCIFLPYASLNAQALSTLPEEQGQNLETIQYLDDQINSLTRLKNYYIAKSTRYRNRANNIRFQQGENYQEEYERLNQQAIDYDKIAKNLG